MAERIGQPGMGRAGAAVAALGRSPAFQRSLPWVYLALAAAFMALYTMRAVWMLPWGITGLTYAPPYPFRYRFLATLLPGGFAKLTGAPLAPLYAVQGTLCVWATLMAYRRLLARFVPAHLAGVLAPGLLYGMAWHYVAMNLLYFPFDMPAVMFFVIGWLLLLERRWWLYYPMFALAVLNRETCLVLTGLLAITEWRRMPARTLLAHVAAQVVLWAALKAGLWLAFAPAGQHLYIDSLKTNRETLQMVLRFHAGGRKTVAKFVCWCGGLWAVLPFIAREQPEPLRRALFVIAPFFLGMLFVGTLREMRIYGELIPVVLTPCLVWLARRIEPEPAR